MKLIFRTCLLTILILSLHFPAWAMERYVNIVQDQQGNALPGTQITVYLAGSTTLADIYSDNSETVKANPFTNHANGLYDFYAANGVYDIRFSRSGSDFSTANDVYKRIALFDVNDSEIGAGSSFWPVNVTGTASTSEDLPIKIRGIGAQANSGWNLYMHSNGTPIIKCVIAGVEGNCNIEVTIDSGNYWALYDSSSNLIVKIEPGASGRLKFTFGDNYRLVKSITLPADAFYMHGCTLVTDQALITGGLTEPYITCGDNDAHGFHRSFGIQDSWDGGTFTATVRLTNVNASPANVYEIDFSAECEANSDVIGTSISSTGEQPATINFANSGSCGTACAQFDLVKVTTAAITPNGTCAGGNLFRFQGNLDATATTTAQVADVKIIDVTIEYSVTSWGD